MAEESAVWKGQDGISQVGSDGMRFIFQHPDLAREAADPLKNILAKVKIEVPQE